MRRFLPLTMLFASFLAHSTVGSFSARASQPSLPGFDLIMTAALATPRLTELQDATAQAETMLEAVNKSRTRQVGRADLDINVRASLIDLIREELRHESNGDTLEAVRVLVKALDLARSLWDAANARQAEKTSELDRLVTALFDRLVVVGSRDRNAATTFGVPDGERLIYRILIANKQQRVSAFELAGVRDSRKATWRETVLSPPRTSAVAAIQSWIDSANAQEAFPINQFHSWLLIDDAALGEANALERNISALAERLLSSGIMTLVISSEDRDMPTTLLPVVSATGRLRADLQGAAAMLVHRPTGASILSWDKLATGREQSRLTDLATELSNELGEDFGAKTVVRKVSLTALLTVAVKVALADGEALSVPTKMHARRVAGGGLVELTPLDELRMTARWGQYWGQYLIQGGDGAVWLRTRDVVPLTVKQRDTATPPPGRTEPSWSKWRPSFSVGKKAPD